MMKQNKMFYEKPDISVYIFQTEDVITLSGQISGEQNSESDFSELLGIEGESYGL